MFASQDLTAILLHANQRSNNSALSLSSLHACVYKMDFGSYSCNTVSTVLTGVTTLRCDRALRSRVFLVKNFTGRSSERLERVQLR